MCCIVPWWNKSFWDSMYCADRKCFALFMSLCHFGSSFSVLKSLWTQLVPHGYCVESNLIRLYTHVSVPYCHSYLLHTYTFQQFAMCQSKNSSKGWHKINSYIKLSLNPHPQWHIRKQKKSSPWHERAIKRERTQGKRSGSMPRERNGDGRHHLHHGHNCFLPWSCAGSRILVGPHVVLQVLWKRHLLSTSSCSLLHWTPALVFLYIAGRHWNSIDQSTL